MDRAPLESAIRPCGVAESALFEYLDVADGYVRTMSEEARSFSRHLETCPDCGREVAAYRSLFDHLRALPVPEPAIAFNRRILDAAQPALAADSDEGFWRRVAALASPGRLWAGGLLALTGATLLALVVAGNGGPRAAVAGALVGSVRWGIDLLGSAVTQLVTAIHVSDLLLEVSQVMKPLWNAAVVVSGAVGPEFWLMSTLLSGLALAGAVRLAAGTGMAARAAEREVRHAAFCF